MPDADIEPDEPPEWHDIMPLATRLWLCETFDPHKRSEEAAALRALMEALRAPAFCRRGRCRRAGRCLSPKVECAWRNIPFLRREVFPLLRKKLARGDGRRHCEEASLTSRRGNP